jgi:Na+/H+-dicarboxylate symporter
MKYAKLLKLLYVQVLIGLVLGIAVGHWWPEFGAALKPLGDGFVKLVKMMIAPIVFCTIVSGITSLNDSKQIGKTLLKSMGLFYALTVLALLTGLAAVFLLQPGAGMHIDPKQLDAAVAGKYASQIPPRGFTEFVLHIIPGSFFGAFADGEVLPVLLLSVLCGFGLTRIGAAGRVVLDGIDGFANMLFAAFGFIMRLAPLGAFGAMAFTVGRYGIKSIGSLGMLIGTFYIACIFFVVVVLGTLAWMHKFKLWQLLRYIREELLVVLGTSSSEPVLPRLLMKLERLGCKKGVVGLVLPTGYSFNLDGTAIYLTLASMFIAQACDITLSWTQIAAMLGSDAAHLQGRRRGHGQRLRRPGRDAGGDAGSAGGRRGVDRRYRPIHVRGARADEHHEQRRCLRRRVDLGRRMRPRGACSRAAAELCQHRDGAGTGRRVAEAPGGSRPSTVALH